MRTQASHSQVWTLCLAISLASFTNIARGSEELPDPASVRLGERLFMDSRFSQAVKQGFGSHVMANTSAGVNCRSCHMVDEQFIEQKRTGMRAYADFFARSPIPAREDGLTHTTRNTPPLVNINLPSRRDQLLHFDARFASMPELVKATLTGRNYGWLADEQKQAIRHIAQVIRLDAGQSNTELAIEGAYRTLLRGIDPSLPEEDRLPARYRLDVASASDRDIVTIISTLIAEYVNQLAFSRDQEGLYNGSPYDKFLLKNQLPRQPDEGQTAIEYGRHLLGLLHLLDKPVFIRARSHHFQTHRQRFRFGPRELAGLKIFLTEQSESDQAVGNCIRCHAPPDFTDFDFHNTAITQLEYDQLHGSGAFMDLPIPELDTRNALHNDYLPATTKHPYAAGVFLSIPSVHKPEQTDLGLWNVFANPDFCAHQPVLENLLCKKMNRDNPANTNNCTTTQLLQSSIALFKTPGLRDLGHSFPYMHNGMLKSLQDVSRHYRVISDQARAGTLRNPAPELSDIFLQNEDIVKLTAFMKALNEDYE